jgi:CDP-glycerol glycerophosphotransferase (TagB/SpsB family)
VHQIKLILNLVSNIFLYGIANIIPKNNNIWVFGAWFGQKYSDNPRTMFKYVNTQDTKIRAIWITKDKSVIDEVKKEGYETYYHFSIMGLWFQLRAGFVFICQSVHDDLFAPSIGGGTKIIQLWHGIPLKKIMFDVFGGRPTNKNLIGKFVDYLSAYNEHRNDYIVATSPLTQEILANAFRVPVSHVLITGFPRNDVFLKEPKTKIKKTPFRCIYMPTFRGGIGSECDLFQQYGFNFAAIEAQLLKHNIQLVLRMHPVNKPPESLVELIKDSDVICFDTGVDIYQTIAEYDCLITDYSSIYFDFILSNKPIIFAPFDLSHYMEKERALYFEFPDVTLTPFCMNWPEIIARLIDIKDNGTSQEYNFAYQELKLRFHDVAQEKNTLFSQQLFDQLQQL